MPDQIAAPSAPAPAPPSPPPVQAADPTKMIGGPYVNMDASGNFKMSGVPASRAEVQAYIDRQSQKLAANNQQLSGPLAPLAKNPAMQQLMADMQEQITHAKELLAKSDLASRNKSYASALRGK